MKQPPPREDLVTHRSLERGLRILESFAADRGPASLTETARRLGLHRSTTHHLMQTLVGLGYFRQDPRTRGYELTAKLFRLTGRTWTVEQLAQIAEPHVTELTALTGEGSSFAAFRDARISIVAKHDTDAPIRVVQDLGADRPFHATAVGKAIVAFVAQSERDAILERQPLIRFTRNTIVSRSALDEELRRIRERGFAEDDEEHHEGIRCVAAPVFRFDRRVIGSLCSVGPKSRMTRQRLREIRSPLSAVARALSERFEWHGDEDDPQTSAP